MRENDAADWSEGMKKLRQFAFNAEGPFVSEGERTPDGLVEVGWDQNKLFPAYRVESSLGSELVPFTPMAQFPPSGSNADWYLEQFSDAAIKQRWAEERTNAETESRIAGIRANLAIPHEFRATGSVDARGKIDANGEVDLREVRGPGFFGQVPWNEPIATAAGSTSIVEVEVPREPFEVLHMGLRDPIRIRGWHLAGKGVPDGQGGLKRAMIIFTAGRSIETTAIEHPDDRPARWDPKSEGWLQTSFPDELNRTECWGAGSWRNNYLLKFWQAGFDVLTFDKRGHGISGGNNDSNTNEQANDIFRALDSFETGRGLRLLTPDGKLLAGSDAAGVLLAGYRAKTLPVFLSGASQGCMVTVWAMHKNFVGSTDFERADSAVAEPLGYSIRGALVLAPFTGGLGYRPADDSLLEASRRESVNVQLFATSEIPANVAKWPSLFIGRGLWDFSESLEGSLDAYRRAKQPKRLAAVRGPHGENEWGQANIDHMTSEMVDFATIVLRDPSATFPGPASLYDVVAAAPASWPEEAKPVT